MLEASKIVYVSPEKPHNPNPQIQGGGLPYLNILSFYKVYRNKKYKNARHRFCSAT